MKHTKFVHNFLEDSALEYPLKKAVFDKGTWYCYQDIEQKVNQLSNLFFAFGIKKGQRIGIFIENSIEYIISYYAILKIGAITVALNTENTAEDTNYILKDCGINLVVTNQKQLKKIEDLFKGKNNSSDVYKQVLVWSNQKQVTIKESGTEFLLLPKSIESYPDVKPDVKIIDLDIASIVYTSGSTGKPRGVTLSHLNIVTNTRSIVEYLELVAEDRIMVVLPFYYIYGKSLLNTHFYAGGSVVIDNRFLYPNVVLQTMKEQQVTGFSGVPSTFTILLNRSDIRNYTFDKLRYITQAGGAMAPSVQKEVVKVFNPAKLFIMYGATEASARLSYLDPKELKRKWGSIGKGIPNVELFVADSKGNALPNGEHGEIVARGSNIMSGYWNHPEETKKVLKKGLYWTGDIGEMDEEGFIYVVGRSKDMIKVGGNRVSAKEIEEALYEHPLINEVAVIGVEDEVLGEAIKAVLVLNNNSNKTTNDEFNTFLRDKIALYKIPKYYEYRDSLPKNESGKIQKLQLKT